MNWYDALIVASFLGEDMKFWGTVLVGLTLKWLFSNSTRTWREGATGIVSGAALAYYGTDWVMTHVPNFTPDDRNIVVIGLVITGEHFVRTLMVYGPRKISAKLGLDSDEEEIKEAARAKRRKENGPS